MRSLLSEGRLVYTTVIGTDEGPKAVTIEREGPTGLLVTTTALDTPPGERDPAALTHAHDTPEQTTAVILAAARETPDEPDLSDFQALDQWLSLGPRSSSSRSPKTSHGPFPRSPSVCAATSARSSASSAHTPCCTRQPGRPTTDGRVVATLDDYAVVRDLVIDALSEGVEAIVPAIVRETVEAIPEQLNSLSVTELAELLHLDKSSTSRRVQQALELGYLANDEERRAFPPGCAAVCRSPPRSCCCLPSRRCSVAPTTTPTNPPPPDQTQTPETMPMTSPARPSTR